MEIKEVLLKDFESYINQNQNDISKLEIIQHIVKSMDKYVNKYEKYLKKKEKYISEINSVIDNFFEYYDNYYWYIKQYNAFYEYNGEYFTLINSDKILINISKFLSIEHYEYKYIIKKIIINNIKKNNLFNKNSERIFKLTKNTYKSVKDLFAKIISPKLNTADHEKSLLYILSYLNKCMTDSEYIGDDFIQLWMGKNSHLYIDLFKELFISIIKNYPKNINNVKFSYNNYDLLNKKLIKFNDDLNIELFAKECKELKESIITTLFYLEQLLPDGGSAKILEQKSSIINFLSKYKSKEILFGKISKENITEDKEGIVYIKEFYNYINNLFSELDLPQTIYSYNELAEYMEQKYNKFIDDNSLTTILLRKKPLIICENESDAWVDGKPTVKNGEKVELLETETEFCKIKSESENIGYVKNENIIVNDNNKYGRIKIKITDNRANLTFRGIRLKGHNKAAMFRDFCKEQIIPCHHGIIRLKELLDIFKNWYFKKESYVSYLSRNDLLGFMSSEHQQYWCGDQNLYRGIKFVYYDKLEILQEFIKNNIKYEENSFLKIEEFYTTFKNWFRSNNEDYLYPDKEDIVEYMNNIYEYKKYKGWINIKFTKNNKLSNIDISSIKEKINSNITSL